MTTSLNLNSSERKRERNVEKLTKWVVTGAGVLIIVALAAVALFLLVQGLPALTAGSENLPFNAANFWQLAGPVAFGSMWAAILALIFAVPVSISAALFITQVAPRRFAKALGAVIDVLAAIPSVIYGLWGLMVLAPMMGSVGEWLNKNLGWIPFFTGSASATGRTTLTAALVLAIMIMPIMTAVCREVFIQTPPLTVEAALALGATKWEVIRLSVLPFGRSGIISGAMLGLGRALGETMAIAMVLSPTPFLVSIKMLTSENPNTIAAVISQTFPEAAGLQVNALIALGLVLFAITFVVNALARRIATRTARKAAA